MARPRIQGLVVGVVAAQHEGAGHHDHGRRQIVGEVADRVAHQCTAEDADDRHHGLEPGQDQAKPPAVPRREAGDAERGGDRERVEREREDERVGCI